ncbi:MAG: GNAT family N-acetyltransferase [Alphaproteobacteria bacterium]|nr:GNAT family N-acetyltransferase [Alphaproteobacteria bacterium]
MTTVALEAASRAMLPARDRLRFTVLPFATWRQEIAPLWHMEGAARFLGPLIGGYGQLQFCGEELAARVRCVPLAAELDGTRVAWTSIYTLSDEALRLRGIYVVPSWRSNGIGRALVDHAESLWPAHWNRVFLYARMPNVERYRRWGFEIVAGNLPRTHRFGPGIADGRIVQMVRWRTSS